jgi:hypothetical protein
MAIAKRPSIFFRSILLASMVSLVACGGGGGGGTKPPAIDTTPNAISFAPTSNAEPSAVVTSQAITISGINTAAPISISGGEYAIAGGAFTATPGTVTNSQSLVIRITASDKTNTPKEATLTVGGVSAKFTVTTFADTTPDAFSFPAKTEAVFNTEYTSDAITVKGIDVAVPVSITGGTYSINGGAFTSAAGTVSADQTITVKTTSASKTESTQSAVLTVGGVDGNFAVTTINDTFPPVAEFKFPTPYTMSEASEVKVRGTATDDNAITSVKLLVRSFNLATPTVTISEEEIDAFPKSETNGVKDFSSWTATIPLTANAENEIKVIATDERNNATIIEQANKVAIRQADVRSAFPDENNKFTSLYSHLLIDNYDGNNRILVVDGRKILEVDMVSGRRITFFEENCNLASWEIDFVSKNIFGMCEGFALKEYDLSSGSTIASYSIGVSLENVAPPLAMVVDRVNNRAQVVIVEYPGGTPGNNGRITAFALEDKNLSVLVRADQPSLMHRASDMIVDGDRYLVPGGKIGDSFGGHVIGINALTGEQTIISDNTIGEGDPYGIENLRNFLSSIIKEEKNNRLFIFEEGSNRIFTLDLSTYARKVFSDISYKNKELSYSVSSSDLKINEEMGHLYLVDTRRQSVLVIDAETGEKVILSKSKNTF